MNIAIIIPTYNEKDNISKLITVLQEEFNKMPKHTFFVVVVDGNSPDGTAECVRELSKNDKRIILISEKEKAGLGMAYIYGMTYALENLKSEALVEMDADFQHDPKDLVRFVSKIEEGYDYVIGSRYMKGGSIPKEWEFYRKLLSFAGNIFTRFVLGIPSIHDITSGYRISRTSVLKKVSLQNLDRRVYAYKIQLLYEMKKKGAKIVEIPIKFGLRDRGESKMGKDNILGSLSLVLSLRYKENETLFKFLLVGIAGLVVQTSIFLFQTFVLSIKPSIALLPAFMAAVFTTFTLNNVWSFKDKKITGKSNIMAKGFQFLVVNVGGYFIQKGSILVWENFSKNVLITVLFGYPMGILLGLVWNYFFYSRIIWRKKV
ncbi:MAG: glycosyltransferase family 2 protein [Patescibacteria group bacterium]